MPSITCSSNPKASLNCHNLRYFHFNDVISYGLLECDAMSTKLYSITSQATNLLTTSRTSALSYGPRMWRDFSLKVSCPFNSHNNRTQNCTNCCSEPAGRVILVDMILNLTIRCVPYIYIYIYSVSQEERSIFWEVIVSVILSKTIYMNMCPIPNGFRDRAIWMYNRKIVDKRYYVYVLFLIPVFIVQVTGLVQFITNFRKFHC